MCDPAKEETTGDGFSYEGEGIKPDYESAAQATMHLAMTQLGLEFRAQAIVIAERYRAEIEEETKAEGG